MEETLQDFWTMVWVNQVEDIVMLTKLEEKGVIYKRALLSLVSRNTLNFCTFQKHPRFSADSNLSKMPKETVTLLP